MKFIYRIAILCIAQPNVLGVETQPNIILIFTDDQGYQDVGCFGSKTIKTPHLDRMATEGVRLTSFTLSRCAEFREPH